MFAMNSEEFPVLPELTTDQGFEIEGGVLRKMITKVTHSIAEQDIRPMLRGAFFSFNENNLEVVSCDSYTLSRCSVSCDIKSINENEKINYSFIIPGHALSELSKNLSEGDDEVVRFYIARKHAIVKKGESIFFTRTIDSEYIDYDKIIPKENTLISAKPKEEFKF